jgi:hypothetical protein
MGVYYLYQSLVIAVMCLGMGLIFGIILGAFGFKFWVNHNELMASKAYQVALNQFKESQDKMLGALFARSDMLLPEPTQSSNNQSFVQNARNSIIPSTRYDIVFDSDLVSFISTGVFSRSWQSIMKDILESIEEKSSSFPEGTNTILVRSVRMSDMGGNEYLLEPIKNDNIKKMSGE